MTNNLSDLKSLMMNSFFTLGRQIGVGIIGVVSAIIIARIYGPDGNGIFAMTMLLPTFLSLLLNMGVNASNVYLISSGKANVRETIQGNLLLSLILSATGLFIGFLVFKFKANEVFPGVNPALLWTALPIFPVALINGFLTSIYQGLQKFSAFNKILIVEPLVFLVAILGVAFSGNKDLSVLILAKLLSTTFSLMLVIMGMIVVWKQSEPQPSNALKFVKNATNYGFKANLGPISQFLNYKADIFVLNLFTNVSITGTYVVAVSLTEKVFLISAAVSTILFPLLSQLSSDEASRKELTPFVSRLVFLITGVGTIGLAILSYPVVRYLFGEDYLSCLSALFILIPGVIILSTAKIWANDIAARGKPEINMYISIFTLIVNVIGNVILIPSLGMNGAALTTTLAYFVCSAITLRYYTKLSANSYSSVFIACMSDFRRLRQVFAS